MCRTMLMCGLLCLVAIVQARVDFNAQASRYATADRNMVFAKDDDWGHLDNCGDAQHNFTFMWKPKKFKIGDNVQINVEFTAQTYIIQVTAHLIVWAKGVKEPIIKTDTQITCAQIKKYVPTYQKYCPLMKGQHIHIKDVSIPVPTTYPVPAGTYIVHLVLTDQDGQPVLCAKGEVQILEAPPPNWDDWRR